MLRSRSESVHTCVMKTNKIPILREPTPRWRSWWEAWRAAWLTKSSFRTPNFLSSFETLQIPSLSYSTSHWKIILFPQGALDNPKASPLLTTSTIRHYAYPSSALPLIGLSVPMVFLVFLSSRCPSLYLAYGRYPTFLVAGSLLTQF